MEVRPAAEVSEACCLRVAALSVARGICRVRCCRSASQRNCFLFTTTGWLASCSFHHEDCDLGLSHTWRLHMLTQCCHGCRNPFASSVANARMPGIV